MRGLKLTVVEILIGDDYFKQGLNGHNIATFKCVSEDYKLALITHDDLLEGMRVGRYELMNGNMTFNKVGKKIELYGENNYKLEKPKHLMMVKLPKRDEEKNMVVIDRIEKDGKLLGYTVYDYNSYGTIHRIKVDDIDKFKYVNGAVVDKDGKKVIRALKGTFNVKETGENRVKDSKDLVIKVRNFSSFIGFSGDVLKGVCIEVVAKNQLELKKCLDLIQEDNKNTLRVLSVVTKPPKGSLMGLKNNFVLKKNREGNGFTGIISFKRFIELMAMEEYSKKVEFVKNKSTMNKTGIFCKDLGENKDAVVLIDMDKNTIVNVVDNDNSRSGELIKEYANQVRKLNSKIK